MVYAWRVLLVLSLVFVAALWLRHRWRGTGGTGEARRRLRVVDSLALGPQRHVHVIEADGRRYLIGVTPQHISLLTPLLGSRDEAADPSGERVDDGAPDFQAVLDGAERAGSGEDAGT